MERIDPESAYPRQEGAYCPSCGRYVGPYRVCPYCGARIEERISTKLLKIFALGFSVVGLVLVWWAAAHRMVPTIQAAEIDNRTNFAYVQMKGICTRTPSYDAKAKSLSFPIDDGTGTVWIKAYGAQAEEIYASGNLPAPGDTVVVEGTVRMKGDYTYLIVNLPEKLVVVEPKPLELDISELSDSLWGVVVKTAGVINSVRRYDTSMRLQLCSPLADACVDMNVYYSSFPNVDPEAFERGDTVAVVAMVGTYRGKLRLVPRREDELWHKKGEPPKRKWTVGEKPPEDAPKVRLKDLTEDMKGKFVRVEGEVKWVKQIKGGVLVQMDDGTEIMTFPIWDRIYETVPNADALCAGATISFVGKVGEYKGALQVVPTYGPAVEVKAPAKKETKAPKIKLSELSKDMLGQKVTVGGKIKSVKKIKGGILVTIDDGTAEMKFPIWDKVLRHVPNRDAIASGNRIEFVGKVTEYKGRLEVVPTWGEDVHVSGAASEKKTSEEPIRIQLIELSDDLLGEIVTVEGEITRVKSIKGGILVTIRQGDEYMTTPIWDDVLSEIADRDRLEKGAYVVITGKVTEYKGRLEVVPRSGADVEVK